MMTYMDGSMWGASCLRTSGGKMENMEVMEHGDTSFMKWHQKSRDRKVFQVHKSYLCHVPVGLLQIWISVKILFVILVKLEYILRSFAVVVSTLLLLFSGDSRLWQILVTSCPHTGRKPTLFQLLTLAKSEEMMKKHKNTKHLIQ